MTPSARMVTVAVRVPAVVVAAAVLKVTTAPVFEH